MDLTIDVLAVQSGRATLSDMHRRRSRASSCWAYARFMLPAFLGLGGCYTKLDPTHLVLAECSFVSLDAAEYAVCSTPLVHAQAARDCELRGARLAEIETSEENAAVRDAAFGVVEGSNVWLGGSRSEDFVWSWSDGTPFWRGNRDGSAEGGAFVLWQAGEPNNTSSTTGEPERCLVLTVDGGDWNDRSCDISLPYVCESE